MKKSTLILYGICAFVWSLKAVLSVLFKAYDSSVFLYILDVLCAVIWIAAFLMWFSRYRKGE